MEQVVVKRFVETIKSSFSPPFSGSIVDWTHTYTDLPAGAMYAAVGKVDLSTSPYLIQPLLDMTDPTVRMVNKFMAVQIGKTFGDDISSLYFACENPGFTLRLYPTDDVAENFTNQRLVPLAKNCEPIKPLLGFNRYSTKKSGVYLPHTTIRTSGAKDSWSHGVTIRYLYMDDAFEYDPSLIEPIIARTNAFAGRRKIVISSQPDREFSVLHKFYEMGKVFEWQWQCPHCKQHQPFYWFKEREDGSYAGFNWDTIENEDGTTNIAASARSTWLECFHCKHQVHDNKENRRALNDNGKYVCIKHDGDPEVHSYVCPAFVNINLSFEYFAVQWLNARRIQRNTGLSDDIITFKNQVLAQFHKRESGMELSKLAVGNYVSTDIWEEEAIRILTVDKQRTGDLLYWILRAWAKSGRESRLLDIGVTRKWDELKTIQSKWKVPIFAVGIDSGDDTTTVYGQCVINGEFVSDKNGRPLQFISWTALKGVGGSDGKNASFKHKDGKYRIYSEQFQGDPAFPNNHKYKGLSANGYRWSSDTVKAILAKLRDNTVPGVKWLTNSTKDKDYETQMWAEGWETKLNDRTKLLDTKWKVFSDNNHWFDAEAQNLAMAIMLGAFSAAVPEPSEENKV